MAYLEPQEQIWRGESGRMFDLTKLKDSNHLDPLDGIAGFDSRKTTFYPKTLFRFPLRVAATDLSENVYTLEKVNELIGALRSEAKLLLLFLRSIDTIEVYNIGRDGHQRLSFQTKIADAFVRDLKQKRASLLDSLRSCHASRPYKISRVYSHTAKFDVCVYDANTRQTTTSHWFAANQVGSENATVTSASVKQKVFPWVGTAVELDNPVDGRIFCFLPMPIETASNLPVHVNGTFGLNDDRRSLKWPGVERRNDATANWNELLVKEVIPPCYVRLLLEAKCYLRNDFYKAWPNVEHLKRTKWQSLLAPVLSTILNHEVIWSEALRQAGQWVVPSTAIYIPSSGKLTSIVERVLTNCGVKLAKIPSSVRDAFAYVSRSTKDVSPKFVRGKLRSTPRSYTSIDSVGKYVLLKYCLSDGDYGDLSGLRLLPLYNGDFEEFSHDGYHYSTVYICTRECPRCLLPNLEHKLVDIPEDADLHQALTVVAKSKLTQLRELTVPSMPSLIDECMPTKWKKKKKQVVTFPDSSNFPSEWFNTFWQWVQNKQLKQFANNLIMPVCKPGRSQECFSVVRLSMKPILYVPSNSSCSDLLVSVLSKFGIFCCVQSFVKHGELRNFTHSLNPNGILEAISISWTSGGQKVNLTLQESATLRAILSASTIASRHHDVLRKLRIFKSASNSPGELHSFQSVYNHSLLGSPVAVKMSDSMSFDISLLPANIIFFSADDHHQNELLKMIGTSFMGEIDFLAKHVFPCISDERISDRDVDTVMLEVLNKFDFLKYRKESLQETIKNLVFIKTASGSRKCPKDLFDPENPDMSAIFAGENVFPSDPYNQPQYISTLQACGLRTSITPQEVLDTIYSLSLPVRDYPQLVSEETFARARALLKYAGTYSREKSFLCSLPSSIHTGFLPFSSGLDILSSSRSWLPVRSSKPTNYPIQLPWKGEDFESHVCSLDTNVSVSSFHKPSHPFIYGSQMYFTDPVIESDVLKSEEAPSLLVAHLQKLIDIADSFKPAVMLKYLHKIYSAMLDVPDEDDLSTLWSVEKWVYIKGYNKFVSPDVVALEQNPSFRHNLEPYLHKLPDSISNYSELFTAFGVKEVMSSEQIVSIMAAMKDDIDEESMSISVTNCWDIVMSILNWLTDNGTKVLEESLGTVYVPIESDSEWPDLQPASDVIYTDNEFLKKFTISSDSETSDRTLNFIHSRVSVKIAECLQLTPLSEELDISADTFEDTGQYEPLTTRLRNILHEYKDGLTIVKELIQNADDAEAGEVNICFDARTHTKQTDKLFFPGMSESHGPALIVHNNQVFTDEDFENITKLAGATKQKKHLKIGKFGIGFCSVYHITDVPSFVSQDRLYIFDPTLKYLTKEIKNPALPGKRLKFTSRIIQNSKQLDPYDNLFHFSRKKSYQGTMFRLPFRTSASELSSKCYSEVTAMELLDSIRSCSENLIMFLQHVQAITFQRIDGNETHPTTLFTVRKESFLLREGLSFDHTSAFSIKSSRSSQTEVSEWLVSTCSVLNEEKPAVASIACKLEHETDTAGVYKLGQPLRGEMFCYLPLSQFTGLPVHVSCNFAVINNRRGIWTADESSSSVDEAEVEWNDFLMENVIPVAYLRLIISLKCMQESNAIQGYKFYDLWPLTSELKQQNPWSSFVFELYENLTSGQLFYSESTNKWSTLKDGLFLEPNILGRSDKTQTCILGILSHLKLPLVDLPAKYREHFDLEDFLMNEVGFIKLFFSKLSSLEDIIPNRNAVIRLLLETYAAESNSELRRVLHDYMKNYACIPCSPDGTDMKKCSELIHPTAPFSKLYDPIEGMFPMENLTQHLTLTDLALEKLDIIHRKISWDYVIERAQTIQALMNSDATKAYSRIKLIIEAITLHTDGKPPKYGTRIDSIEFLPIMKKPNDFPLKWHGEGMTLGCGNQIVKTGPRPKMPNVNIAGSQVVLLCEAKSKDNGCGHVGERAEEILGLKASPSLTSGILHFMLIIDNFASIPSSWVDQSCKLIYDFMEEAVSKKQFTASESLLKLMTMPCVWTGGAFIHIQDVSFKWALNGPYLYQVPSLLRNKTALCSVLGIMEEFSIGSIRNALEKMKNDFGDRPIDKSCQPVIRQILPLLHDQGGSEFKDGDFLLPNENYVLCRSKDLAYNDAPWAPRDDTYTYVNEIVPRKLAKKMGVQAVRSKFLDKYVSQHGFAGGVEFGQHEELTRRIQNILRDYPLDVTLIKELLQNADDAKATKMYVILDKRHHKKTSILSEEWKDLQGPALLVWNDSVFSENDLKGIQQLGFGSKRSEAETIGQYGIGFNVVYHVTDCPSFVTNDRTLCVMDPHCRYVPGAEPLHPGRRYDKLDEGFWKDFPDMKSAYLRDHLKNVGSEIMQGSLFRFPIRHNKRKITHSEIVGGMENAKVCLSADDLCRDLNDWMPKMKQAMFFLNNVTEIKFFTIEANSCELRTVFHYRSKINESALPDRVSLQKSLSAFKRESGCKSCVIMYPLTLIEVRHDKETKEEWLIQQGVGDINNEQQVWKYVNTVKPRHGIAVPLSTTTRSEDFRGQVFCFLPLPVQSGLPVHINGHFILNSTRRELWKSSDIHFKDDRSRWNDNLVKALSSSYADLLVRARTHYVSDQYRSILTARSKIGLYYTIFPKFHAPDRIKPTPVSSLVKYVASVVPEKNLWETLAHDVYEFLLKHNHPVLCTIESKNDSEEIGTKWCHLKTFSPADHVYFRHASLDRNKIDIILEGIGMRLTPAPSHVMDSLNAIIKESKSQSQFCFVSRNSVFEYYTKHSKHSAARMLNPAAIKTTGFQDVRSFLIFTKYLLAPEPQFIPSSSVHTQRSSKRAFPNEPFNHYLLLTADGILRKFDANAKVLMSSFSHLFPENLKSFVHPDLLVEGVNYVEVYFIQPDDDSLKRVQNLILLLLDNNLPKRLKAVNVVSNAATVISREQVISLWECFAKDKVFAKHISNILKHWALLLTRDDRLFSTSSNILPVCQTSSQDYEMCKVMKKLNMPFLDTTVVIADSNCPNITDKERILTNLYYTNLDTSMLTLLQKQDLETIITFLRGIMMLSSNETKKHVQYLPLFEEIDGNYTSIWNKTAYIWPSEATCYAAYKKWVEEYNAAFLHRFSKWSQLGSAEQLSIQTISAEELYVKYIFPKFFKLNSKERYQHLEFIRDSLYQTMKINSETVPYHTNRRYGYRHESYQLAVAKQQRALSFLQALKSLRCIGDHDDGSNLRPVNGFCDHTVEIFTAFSSHFIFLPDKYKDWRWLEFFKELGLKQTVSQEEYLTYCRETASGKVSNVKKCSTVLLEHLFSQPGQHAWQNDEQFLRSVSNIAFVVQVDLPKLTWLVPSFSPVDQLVKLNGSTIISRAHLLWTFKPTVQLPTCVQSSSPFMSFLSSSDALLKNLGVTKDPSVAEVIVNMKNICEKTQYTDPSLFANYPKHLVCPSECDNLLKIMLESFTYIHGNSYDVSSLKSLACIPVYNTTATSDFKKSKVVLVKPSSCVMGNTMKVKKFHPFLHILPQELMSTYQLLQNIGVKNSLELSHIQIVLKSTFKGSEGCELDINTKKCVILAVETLKKFLDEQQESRNAEVLSPLYLPDTENKLRPSQTLLYGDTTNYWGKVILDLSDVPYSHFDIPVEEYKFRAHDICRLLPDTVRPIGLSTVCKHVVLQESQQTQNSALAEQLMATVEFPELPEGIVFFINMYVGMQENEEGLKELIKEYLTGISVVTVTNLRIQIVLKDCNKCIGTLKKNFCYVPGESECILYLDSELAHPVDNDDAYLAIADDLRTRLCQKIKEKTLSDQDHNEISRVIKTFLRADTADKVQHALIEFGVDLQGDKKVRSFPKTLGAEIPSYWHHRLDQDLYNVFNPMEYAGYEDRDDHIIIVQIVHPVKLEEGRGELEKKYRVYMKENDPDGKDVSILSLYKFLVGHKKPKLAPKPAETDVLGLVLYQGDSDAARLRDTLIKEDIVETKKKICKQLKEIWKLPQDLRRKAIKRLFLRHHPDKNRDNPEEAEEIFKYLMKQIDHLEKGEPLDCPETDDAPRSRGSSAYYRSTGGSGFRRYHHNYYSHSSNYSHDFRQWNSTAGRHGSSSHHEQDFFSSADRSHANPRTSDFFPFDEMQDPKDPEEGWRWVKQAKVEFGVLKVVHSHASACSGYSYVCFMAHQVVEKALKGGVYAVCGKDGRILTDNQLSRHAYALETAKPDETQGLAQHCIPLEQYYLKTRYPNFWPGYTDTPSDHYTLADADQARDHAKAVLGIVKDIMPAL